MTVINYDEGEKDTEQPYSQDGITRIINGYEHIYGCTSDYECLVYDGPFSNYRCVCDCPCHNHLLLPIGLIV